MKDGEIMNKRFSFEKLAPLKITASLNKIENSSIYKGKSKMIFTMDDFKKSYKKLISNELMTERDYLILISFLEEVVKNNSFNMLIDKLQKDSQKNTVLNKSFDLIISSFYSDTLKYFQKEVLFNIMYDYFMQTKISRRNNFIQEKVLKSDTLNDYLESILSEVSLLKYNIYSRDSENTKFRFNNIIRKHYIDIHTKFYFECLMLYLNNNYLDDKMWLLNKDVLLALSFENKKIVIKNILSSLYKNKSKIDISEYPDNFFFLVESFLGTDIDNYRWDNISVKEKNVYLLWIKDKGIKKFFDSVSKNGDASRLKFWRGYLDKILDIYNHENLNNVLAMEFKNHIIIEFAEIGNATYIYSKDILSIDMIKEIALDNRLNKYLKVKRFKREDLCVKKLNHSKSWQNTFETELNKLGYRKDEY